MIFMITKFKQFQSQRINKDHSIFCFILTSGLISGLTSLYKSINNIHNYIRSIGCQLYFNFKCDE